MLELGSLCCSVGPQDTDADCLATVCWSVGLVQQRFRWPGRWEGRRCDPRGDAMARGALDAKSKRARLIAELRCGGTGAAVPVDIQALAVGACDRGRAMSRSLTA